MKVLNENFIKILIIVVLMVSCAEDKEIKMVIFNENYKNILEDIILYKKYNLEIIDNGNFWIIKNINEEVLLEFIGIAHLKLDVIGNNIANVNTENYVRKYIRITEKNGVEIVNDTKNVDLTEERLHMLEITHLYEALVEYLRKINENIILI